MEVKNSIKLYESNYESELPLLNSTNNGTFTILENRLKITNTKIIWIAERMIVTTILYFIAYTIPSFNTFLNLVGMIFGTFL